VKALVYHGGGRIAWQEHPKPSLRNAGDAIVRMLKTTICGTDLHIVRGDVPTCTPGRVLGHEGVGVVESVGAGVTMLRPDEHVLISGISSCGKCGYCQRGLVAHCPTGGWKLGNTIDGTQAEYVRIPHAQNSLYPIPAGAGEAAIVALGDILPTGFECGLLNGKVAPGASVAIVGGCSIALAALLAARLYAPAKIIVIDVDGDRLAMALRLGATYTLDSARGDTVARVLALTAGRGVDTAIEAVGVPATLRLCHDIVARRGEVVGIGVHGQAVPEQLEALWSQTIAITSRLIDRVSTPMLLKRVVAAIVEPLSPPPRRFKFQHMLEAYDTVRRAAGTGAPRVIIET
jgi:alcohol dehydrogenase